MALRCHHGAVTVPSVTPVMSPVLSLVVLYSDSTMGSFGLLSLVGALAGGLTADVLHKSSDALRWPSAISNISSFRHVSVLSAFGGDGPFELV